MEQIASILWFILGVALIVAEVFTLGFFLLWFGIGAIAAALTAFLGFGPAIQISAFILVSVGLTAMSRTLFSQYFATGGGDNRKMGIDSLPGQIGTVTTASKGSLNEGAVRVFGSIWTAFPADIDTLLIDGEKVEVVEVKGSSIYVKRVTNELSRWKQD